MITPRSCVYGFSATGWVMTVFVWLISGSRLNVSDCLVAFCFNSIAFRNGENAMYRLLDGSYRGSVGI